MNKKKIWIILFACTFLTVAGICYSCTRPEDNSVVITSSEDISHVQEKVLPIEAKDKTPEEKELMIYIHICGAVKAPDVYEVKVGARLIDAILLAGGLRQDAAGDYINQAQLLADGQRIYIPTVEETEQSGMQQFLTDTSNSIAAQQVTASLININTADSSELMKLPGIGQVRAQAIIDYRNQNGKFSNIEELMNVAGIKQGLYDRVSHLITTN